MLNERRRRVLSALVEEYIASATPVGSKTLEKAARPDPTSLKALELAHRPRHERLIDVAQQRRQRRWCVSPVVGHPTPKERIEPPGERRQRPLGLTAKVQVPYRGPHGVERRDTDGGVEAAEQCVIPNSLHQTGTKAVSEEIELNIRIPAAPLAVLAISDLGFGRMQFQTARGQADLKVGLEGYRFLLAVAVHPSIIGIPTPREVGVGPRHPEIERVVEKSVR